eukprot:6184153-Pleurochrysis_carterae.AAC.1
MSSSALSWPDGPPPCRSAGATRAAWSTGSSGRTRSRNRRQNRAAAAAISCADHAQTLLRPFEQHGEARKHGETALRRTQGSRPSKLPLRRQHSGRVGNVPRTEAKRAALAEGARSSGPRATRRCRPQLAVAPANRSKRFAHAGISERTEKPTACVSSPNESESTHAGMQRLRASTLSTANDAAKRMTRTTLRARGDVPVAAPRAAVAMSLVDSCEREQELFSNAGQARHFSRGRGPPKRWFE